eukprot:11168896-Alexandrium_andersonii.AAC.1
MVYHELVVTWARWSWRCGGRRWSGSWGSSCGVGRFEVIGEACDVLGVVCGVVVGVAGHGEEGVGDV